MCHSGAIHAQRTRLKCTLVPRNVSLVRNRGRVCLGRFSDSPNVDSLSFRRQRQGRSAHYKLRRTTKLSGEQMPVLSHQARVHATATYSVYECYLHSAGTRALLRYSLPYPQSPPSLSRSPPPLSRSSPPSFRRSLDHCRRCLDRRRCRLAILSIAAVVSLAAPVVSLAAAVVSIVAVMISHNMPYYMLCV